MQKQSETIRSYTRVPGNIWPLWSIPAIGALSAQQGFPACEVPAHVSGVCLKPQSKGVISEERSVHSSDRAAQSRGAWRQGHTPSCPAPSQPLMVLPHLTDHLHVWPRPFSPIFLLSPTPIVSTDFAWETWKTIQQSAPNPF